MAPIVRLPTLYFFLFGRRARNASLDYLARVARAMPESGLQPTLRMAWRHFKTFETAILDKLDAWLGRLRYEQVVFEGTLTQRGVLAIGSHLGNLEICRALATMGARAKLNVLVHTAHADYFNRVLKMAGASEVELIEVTQLDIAMALRLKSRIERGEWVVITGDRIPVTGMRTVDVNFLGGTAALPIGPYVLASLLECPVQLLFCLSRNGRNHVYAEPFAERIQWRRPQRDAVIAAFAQRFADRLEHYLRLEPLQWFNFYPFWRT
jgi:predicted LPLAT superfamily acyltransferase